VHSVASSPISPCSAAKLVARMARGRTGLSLVVLERLHGSLAALAGQVVDGWEGVVGRMLALVPAAPRSGPSLAGRSSQASFAAASGCVAACAVAVLAEVKHVACPAHSCSR